MWPFNKKKEPFPPKPVIVTQGVEMQEVVVAESKYPEVVQQIHREFFGSADEALAEAKNVMAQGETKEFKKGQRLAELGFNQAEQGKDAVDQMRKIEVSKETAELIMKYKVQYPLNKFITEDQVHNICMKYNLVCGPNDRYKGFIPEKNLAEIETFFKKYDFKGLWRMTQVQNVGADIKDKIIDLKGWVPKQDNTGYLHFYKEDDVEYKGEYHFQRNIDTERWYGSGHINGEHIRLTDWGMTLVKSPLEICAPIKDMDLTGLELIEGYKLKKFIPDPVVLQSVQGGYLIVTAWGDEASDPDVINEILN